MLAAELRDFPKDAGASVVGPVGTIEHAFELIDAPSHIDIALLDASLQGEMVYPVADRLQELGIPFLFTTGYERLLFPTGSSMSSALGSRPAWRRLVAQSVVPLQIASSDDPFPKSGKAAT